MFGECLKLGEAWGMGAYLAMRNQFRITLSEPLIHLKVLCFDTMTPPLNPYFPALIITNATIMRAFTQRNVQHAAYLLIGMKSTWPAAFPQRLTPHVHQP